MHARRKVAFLTRQVSCERGPDVSPSSLLIRPESLSFLSNQSIFLLRPRTKADLLRMVDFRLYDWMSEVVSSVQGDIFSFCRRSACSFAFTCSRHRLLTLSFLAEFTSFLGLGLNSSSSLQRTRRWLKRLSALSITVVRRMSFRSRCRTSA